MRSGRRPVRASSRGRQRASPGVGTIEGLLDSAAAHYVAGRVDEAAELYRRAERQDPADFRARYSLAVIDLRAGRFEVARSRLTRVTRAQPGHYPAWHNLGVTLQALGRWGKAATAYAKARALRPDAAESGFSLAVVLATLGRTGEALDLYRALAVDPALRGRALARLAILRPSAASDLELNALEDETQLAGSEAIALRFALAAVLDARGDFDAAFENLKAGSALMVASLNAGAPDLHPTVVEKAHRQAADHVRNRFTPEFIAVHAGDGDRRVAPIFLVGFPRSGSTLVEQILASHPDVAGLGEITALPAALGGRFPYYSDAPQDSAPFRHLARAYQSTLQGLGWNRSLRPADKTLENYLHVGAISLMFPRAVILHCLREPADTCMSCYRQLFASGAETLYNLGQIGREYVVYRGVMDHWEAVLPGRVTPVSYEALTDSPEAYIRWLVTEACGLAWSPLCLRFHETRRAVATASADEVRRPIYRTSLDRWRRYERHLGPLFAALGPYAPPRS